ncbi:MAG: hypothetical protein ACWGNO_15940, partial [Desulfobacterales bacterium]
LPIIGPPDKGKQQRVFDNPKNDDTPKKPAWQHDPVLDNNQDQNKSREFRDIEQNVSEIDRPRYFPKFEVHFRIALNRLCDMDYHQRLFDHNRTPLLRF